jgi:hypothetical protein
MLTAIGKITVVVAGTPVRLTSTQSVPADKFACHGVLIQTLAANTGKMHIGLSTMNKGTGAGVIAVLAIPTTNSIPSFTAALTLSPNAINLADLYLDADNGGEGAQVSVLIA